MLILSHILSLTSRPLSDLCMALQMAFIPDWMVSWLVEPPDLSCTVLARLGLLLVRVLTLGARKAPPTPPAAPGKTGPAEPGYCGISRPRTAAV